LARRNEDGTTTKLQEEFLSILNAAGYPAEWLSGIAFSLDSHENVKGNYQGSYFYRLR
jgi:hypothetical protein